MERDKECFYLPHHGSRKKLLSYVYYLTAQLRNQVTAL